MEISEAQYKSEKQYPDKLRSCYNCKHLIEVINLWCGNKDAIQARGTQIPGCVHCPFWEPNKKAQLKINKNITKEIEKGNYYLAIKIQ